MGIIKNKLVEVELADYFKIVLHNTDTYLGCFYIENEWDITIYSSTIADLIVQATESMASQLIDVARWELAQCQVLIYNGNIYEVKESVKNITSKYSTLVDDIISTDLYIEARQKEKNARRERARRYKEKRKSGKRSIK